MGARVGVQACTPYSSALSYRASRAAGHCGQLRRSASPAALRHAGCTLGSVMVGKGEMCLCGGRRAAPPRGDVMAKKVVGTFHFGLSNQSPSEGANHRAEGRQGLGRGCPQGLALGPGIVRKRGGPVSVSLESDEPYSIPEALRPGERGARVWLAFRGLLADPPPVCHGWLDQPCGFAGSPRSGEPTVAQPPGAQDPEAALDAARFGAGPAGRLSLDMMGPGVFN